MAARLQPAIFRYKPVAGVPSPVASAGLFVAGKWRAVEFYVDSGASYTVMPAQFAADFGVELAERGISRQYGVADLEADIRYGD